VTERKKRAKADESKPDKPRTASVESNDDVTEERDAAAGFESSADAFDGERLRPGSPTDTVLTAVLEAGPEAVDHLLKAAYELLLAAKAVVDAGERVIEQTRSASGNDGGAAHGSREAADEPRVRRIDLA
jgi:hypothetical protein